MECSPQTIVTDGGWNELKRTIKIKQLRCNGITILLFRSVSLVDWIFVWLCKLINRKISLECINMHSEKIITMAEIDVIRRILMCCCLRVSIKSINSEGKVEFNKSILADKISTVYHLWYMNGVYITVIIWFDIFRIYSIMEQNVKKYHRLKEILESKAFHNKRAVNSTFKYKYFLRFDKQITLKTVLPFTTIKSSNVCGFRWKLGKPRGSLQSADPNGKCAQCAPDYSYQGF